MENTPSGCGSDLLTILGISNNGLKSRSVYNFQRLDLDPNSRAHVFASLSSAQTVISKLLTPFSCCQYPAHGIM